MISHKEFAIEPDGFVDWRGKSAPDEVFVRQASHGHRHAVDPRGDHAAMKVEESSPRSVVKICRA
jgi:hypothetical protein